MAEPRRWGSLSDQGLGAVLAVLGESVAFPKTPDLAPAVAERLHRAPSPSPGLLEGMRRSLRSRLNRSLRPVVRPAWQPVAVTLVLLVAILSGTLAFSPSARRAVAGWLGLRGVKIEIVPTLPSASPRLGSTLDLGDPVTLAQARDRVPFDILLPSDPGLGAPDEVYVRNGFLQNQVWLVYRARPGLSPGPQTGVALLITEFRATIDRGFLEKKALGDEGTIESVTVNGGDGFWLTGHPHELTLIDEKGRPAQDRTRLAGDVLLWEQGDLTIRIEGALSKEQALAIAGTMG